MVRGNLGIEARMRFVHIHSWKSQAIRMLQANFMWAYATLGERMGGACLEALATQTQKLLPQSHAQDMAKMWAIAKLSKSPDPTLLRSCEAHAARVAGTFIPQDLVRCSLTFKSATTLPL